MGFPEIFAQYRKLAAAPVLQASQADIDNYHKLLKDGGFSHHLTTHETPTSGYMVGLNKEHGGVAHVFPLSELTPEKLTRHRAEAQAAGNDDAYQGGWVQDGKVYLDLSRKVDDRDQAVAMGKAHNQRAIYHLDKGEDIPTGGTGE